MSFIVVLTVVMAALLPGAGKVVAGEAPAVLQVQSSLCVGAQSKHMTHM
jgi:hypothetical protein